MSIELHVLSGARAGQRAAYDQPVVTVGRHPTCDFRFDPEQDREVSTRHAEFRLVEDRWVIVDNNSTNGTFVNGQRLHGEAELLAGDVVSFGATGPRVEVLMVSAVSEAGAGPPKGTRVSWGGRGTPPSMAAGNPGAAAAPLRPSIPSPAATGPAGGATARSTPQSPALRAPAVGQSPTSVRIAAAVEESTKGLRRMLVGVTVLLVVAIGGAIAYTQFQDAKFRREAEADRERSRRRIDSLNTRFDQVRGQLAVLDSAYRAEQERSAGLLEEISAAARRGSAEDVQELRGRLAESQQRAQGILRVGEMDLPRVNRLSGPAVVFIATQQQDGQSFSGSGFNVLASGLVVTNRHVVQDPQGRPVRAVRVLFNGRRGEWLPARVLTIGTSRDDDLALLQIEEPGAYPVVAGVAASRARVEQGSPVTTIGFPLGADLPGVNDNGDINTLNAAATLTPGTVSKVLPNVVQIDSYSGQGASGSPLFDGAGNVVGVIYGGAPGSNGRIVYAVPSERLIAMLPREAGGVVR